MKRCYPLLLILLFFGCDSEDAWNCVQKTGDIERFTFHFDETITHLEVYDDFQVIFYPSEGQRVEVETGRNLINEVVLVMSNDSTLVARNNNNCNWTRKPHNLTLHFYSNDLRFFEKVNFGEVRSEGQLQWEKFEILTKATGNVTLDLRCDELFFGLFSLSNVTLTGEVANFTFGVDPKIDGRLDALGLVTPLVSFYHSGTNDVFIRSTERVFGTIRSLGEVYLHGNPDKIEVENFGQGGQLIVVDP